MLRRDDGRSDARVEGRDTSRDSLLRVLPAFDMEEWWRGKAPRDKAKRELNQAKPTLGAGTQTRNSNQINIYRAGKSVTQI